MVGTKQTQLLQVNDLEKDAENIRLAAEMLRAGKLVVIPTETVYGLGANALDCDAVEEIFVAKGRPQDNPLIVHISKVSDVKKYATDIPEIFYELAARFWPGPLTMILKKSGCIPSVTSGGLDTVAIRMPAHPVARAIISKAGIPLAAPSANLSGSPSTTTAEHCIRDLSGRVDAIVDSGCCEYGIESTVISIIGRIPRLLRPGAVTLEQLQQTVGEIEVDPAVLHQMKEGVKAASPGMKYKHYAPKAKVVLVDADSKTYAEFVNKQEGDGVYAMCFVEDVPRLKKPYVLFGSRDDDFAQAKELFYALRDLDDKGAELVFARCPSKKGVGLAVYNRLLRAAAFEVMKL